VKERGQGRPDQKPTSESGKPPHGFPNPQIEQPPHGGGVNKPELHPPKDISLPLEPKLPKQPDDLDPEIEEAIRRYGMTFEDPQDRAVEEERLRQGARKYREVRESLLHPFPTTTLARPAPDIIGILKKLEKKE
jgi:hypothetical protein